MTTLSDLIAKTALENAKAEFESPEPTPEEVAKEAKFLKGWAKKTPIVRLGAESTFWKKGKYMTKITYKMAAALQAGGYAELKGDPARGGATLRMK